jgi:hypothetical protein
MAKPAKKGLAKQKKTPPAKKPAAKKLAKRTKAAPRVEASPVVSEPSPRAERGMSALVCAQCQDAVDPGALRIVLDAGEALHPGCTFGWTLDHLESPGATADWMATLMQRSQLTPEDRAELLEELGAPSA